MFVKVFWVDDPKPYYLEKAMFSSHTHSNTHPELP